MKSIWKGSISFGLINIPVKIYTAVEESSLDLDMLDSKDHSQIRFKRVNENTGKEVEYKDIIKGYKLNDEYVKRGIYYTKCLFHYKIPTLNIRRLVLFQRLVLCKP